MTGSRALISIFLPGYKQGAVAHFEGRFRRLSVPQLNHGCRDPVQLVGHQNRKHVQLARDLVSFRSGHGNVADSRSCEEPAYGSNPLPQSVVLLSPKGREREIYFRL